MTTTTSTRYKKAPGSIFLNVASNQADLLSPAAGVVVLLAAIAFSAGAAIAPGWGNSSRGSAPRLSTSRWLAG